MDAVPFGLGLLVHAATCIYAVFGFSLSVFAALIGLLDRREIPAEKSIKSKPSRPQLRARPSPARSPSPSAPQRVTRTNSDNPPQLKSILNVYAPAREVANAAEARKRMLASHRRSRSIPIITIDYFGSTGNLGTNPPNPSTSRQDETGTPSLPVRKPLTFVLTTPDREPRPRATSAGELSGKTPIKSSGLLKENRSLPKRSVSNPHLNEFMDKKGPMRRTRSSEFDSNKTASDAESKPRKRRRQVSDATSTEKFTTRFQFAFSRTTEKKKAPTIRTQPYDAPHYCPPPDQIRKVASCGDLTGSAKKC